jgi:dephospho-CoA kinase
VNTKKLVIGLTGGIGSGKSQVARMLELLGAPIVDADHLGHQSYDPESPEWRRIVGLFGLDILNKNETINRNKLADIVFRDSQAMKDLNKIVHPRIRSMAENKLRALNQTNADTIVVEAALLIEADWISLVDQVWSIQSTTQRVIERLKRERGLSEKQIKERMQFQMTAKELSSFSDVIIRNNGSLKQLEQQVRILWDNRYKQSKKGKNGQK